MNDDLQIALTILAIVVAALLVLSFVAYLITARFIFKKQNEIFKSVLRDDDRRFRR